MSLSATNTPKTALFLTAIAGLSLGHSGAMAQTWPVGGTPAVTSSFGDDENNRVHGGIDIPRPVNSLVCAVRNATITSIFYVAANPSGFDSSTTAGAGAGRDVFQVSAIDAAGNEYLYQHMRPPAGGNILVGQAIVEGAGFARIRGGGVDFGGTFDHLHLGYSANPNTGPTTRIDPLRNLFPARTVAENINVRNMTFRSVGGNFADFGQDTTPALRGKFVKGGVDMISEIVNNMGNQARVGAAVVDPRGTGLTLFNGISAVPGSVTYHVEKPADLPRGDIASRQLVKFDQRASVHTGQINTIYDRTRNVTPDGSNTYNYNFIITQTDGTTPNGANFWRTNADKAGAGALGDGSGRGVAAKNADCAFPDGVYNALPNGWSHDDQTGWGTHFNVLVNNFNQVALPAKRNGEMAPAGGESIEANDGNASTFSPSPTEVFVPGEDLYIKGSEFVENQGYSAWATPWRSVWNDGDSLSGIAASVVSDSNGFVPGQVLWSNLPDPGTPALYNVVLDYNHDGMYTWGLDGVGTFTLVPAPGAGVGALVLLGLGAARRRRNAA